MKAIVNGHVLAESNDVVEYRGYRYFPGPTVRLESLEKTPKTVSDLACPHGVQFYDVVIGGTRHARAAWSYESPRDEARPLANRFGFWKDVEVF